MNIIKYHRKWRGSWRRKQAAMAVSIKYIAATSRNAFGAAYEQNCCRLVVWSRNASRPRGWMNRTCRRGQSLTGLTPLYGSRLLLIACHYHSVSRRHPFLDNTGLPTDLRACDASPPPSICRWARRVIFSRSGALCHFLCAAG